MTFMMADLKITPGSWIFRFSRLDACPPRLIQQDTGLQIMSKLVRLEKMISKCLYSDDVNHVILNDVK